jgi:hypothetical protein
MKFYLWERIARHRHQKRPRIYRRAHILKDETTGSCWCEAPLNPEKWIIVEALPLETHLCSRCRRLAKRNNPARQDQANVLD